MKAPSINFEKTGGLVPAIIQDSKTGEVRMLGYMNEEALRLTAKDGWVTFWSRSREKLWQKGETSGNRLKVVSMAADCDADALLIQAEPQGPTCHTGSQSCFGDSGASSLQLLADLYEVIRTRKVEMPEGSYTTKLFESGVDRIAQKVGEEAVEVVIASKNPAKDKFVGEVADLTYHLFVLLAERGVTLEDVAKELRSRTK
jgi:phosphoribosyl-AMP cyclohydrolase / phosphoribosyl-ATP pyrophosphohydrolase